MINSLNTTSCNNTSNNQIIQNPAPRKVTICHDFEQLINPESRVVVGNNKHSKHEKRSTGQLYKVKHLKGNKIPHSKDRTKLSSIKNHGTPYPKGKKPPSYFIGREKPVPFNVKKLKAKMKQVEQANAEHLVEISELKKIKLKLEVDNFLLNIQNEYLISKHNECNQLSKIKT